MATQNFRANAAEINEIALYIGNRLRRYRLPVSDAKEKYGTVRIYCSFGWLNLHDVIYPGYHFNQFPRWLQSLDTNFLSSIVQYTSKVVEPYHRYVYRKVYADAVKKWPHFRTAILVDADWPELLRGL